MIPKGFHRVRKAERCPRCGKGDWCLIANDGSRAVCSRIRSNVNFGDAGWLHNLAGSAVLSQTPEFFRDQEPDRQVMLDVEGIIRRYKTDTTTLRLEKLAASLGVIVRSLQRLDACWSVNHYAWAFPMRDAKLRMIGIRLRTEEGKKFAVRGSRAGLFLPCSQLGLGPLLIGEGPTDTAALLSLGYDVIGRPSCNGCERTAKDYIMLRRSEVVIAANYDRAKTTPDGRIFFPGQEGAESLAQYLHVPVKIVYPPRHKDYRAWINAGATRESVDAVIRSTEYCRLSKSEKNFGTLGPF